MKRVISFLFLFTLFVISTRCERYYTPSYDKLILMKSRSLTNVHTGYNVSKDSQERLRNFIETAITCPKESGRILELPFCYRHIALDKHNYVCCDASDNFTGLHLYPLVLTRKETSYLLEVLRENDAKTSKRLILLNVPFSNGTTRKVEARDRAFHIIQKRELEQLRRFIHIAIQCPNFMGRTIKMVDCHKRIAFAPYYVCCNAGNAPTSVKVHSILYNQTWEIYILNKTLNDECYSQPINWEILYRFA